MDPESPNGPYPQGLVMRLSGDVEEARKSTEPSVREQAERLLKRVSQARAGHTFNTHTHTPYK